MACYMTIYFQNCQFSSFGIVWIRFEIGVGLWVGLLDDMECSNVIGLKTILLWILSFSSDDAKTLVLTIDHGN